MHRLIGAGVSLAFGQSGTAYFAYQNQSQISLRLASEPAGCGTQNPSACTLKVINEWDGPPEGFYSQVAIDGTQGYTCSAQIKALTSRLGPALDIVEDDRQQAPLLDRIVDPHRGLDRAAQRRQRVLDLVRDIGREALDRAHA